MEFGIILVKLVSGFLALVICLKFTGAKGVSNLSPIDFIWSILLSEIVGNGLYDDQVKWYTVLMTLVVWCLLKVLFDMMMFKSAKIEVVVAGEQKRIIYNGKVDETKMRDCRLDYEDLHHALRKQGIFSIEEIEQAFLEKDGTVTVQKRTEFEPVTKGDMTVE